MFMETHTYSIPMLKILTGPLQDMDLVCTVLLVKKWIHWTAFSCLQLRSSYFLLPNDFYFDSEKIDADELIRLCMEILILKDSKHEIPKNQWEKLNRFHYCPMSKFDFQKCPTFVGLILGWYFTCLRVFFTKSPQKICLYVHEKLQGNAFVEIGFKFFIFRPYGFDYLGFLTNTRRGKMKSKTQ